jgi:glycosyltransferase involved in cell wall biosynthesis
MPKVSVIIPVYNTEKYLTKCLDSVCNQTLVDIEIICINDCSTDNSLKILQDYAQKDTRIKIIDFKENKGVSIARNTGIDFSNGEYIGFVDSDDYIDLDFYEKLYNKAIETSADVVKGNIYNVDENGNNPILTEFYNLNDKIYENKFYFYYGFTSAIYKTDLLQKKSIKFPENISYFEDPYFSINVIMNNQKLVICNSAKYFYRKIETSLSNITINSYLDFVKILPEYIKILEQLNNEKNYVILLEFLQNYVRHFVGMYENSTNNTFQLAEYWTNFILNCKYSSILKEYLKTDKLAFLPKFCISKLLIRVLVKK